MAVSEPELQWISVSTNDKYGFHVSKAKVPGGWLYRSTGKSTPDQESIMAMAFVPDLLASKS